jgi:hypothetical protein
MVLFLVNYRETLPLRLLIGIDNTRNVAAVIRDTHGVAMKFPELFYCKHTCILTAY